MFCNNLTNQGKKILQDLSVPREKQEEYLSILTDKGTGKRIKLRIGFIK